MVEFLPQLGLLVGLFFALVGYMAARGTLAIWTHSIGYMLEGLARILKFSAGSGWAKITVDLGGPVRALDHAVVSALQTWADGAEIEVGYFLHGNAILWHWMVSELDSFAQSTAQFGEWLLHVHLPKWAKYLAAAAVPFGLIAKLVHDAIAHELPRIGKQVKVIERTLPGKTITIVKRAGAVVIPGAIALPWITREIHGLTKRNAKIIARLHRLEGIFSVVGAAAIIANVLGLPNWRCLTRGNIGKTARALCGIPAHFLNDLLGLIADFLILENVCVVLPWLEAGVADVAVPLVAVLTDVGAGLCHGSIGAAKPLQGPMPVVPPVTYGSASLAV